MIAQAGVGDRCRFSANGPVRLLTVLLGMTAALSFAQAPDVVPAVPNDGQVSSNQSVALPDDPGPAVESNLPDEAVAASANEGPPSPTFSRRRAVARRPILETEAGAGGVGRHQGASPWYRTGLGALGLVLALVALVYAGVRRWVPSVRSGDSGLMRVVSRTSLTPKQHVVLLQVGRRLVLVGVGSDQVRNLCEITDQSEVAELTAGLGTRNSRGSFDDKLFSQVSEYREDWEEEGAADDRSRPRRQPERAAPLKELLLRLRELKIKE